MYFFPLHVKGGSDKYRVFVKRKFQVVGLSLLEANSAMYKVL